MKPNTNQIYCLECRIQLKKNGLTWDRRQKWRCTACGASQTSEGGQRIHPKKDSKPVGRPTIYPGRKLTNAENCLRYQRKKTMLALKEKFGDD